jgi:arginyl-tRNA synthetase
MEQLKNTLIKIVSNLFDATVLDLDITVPEQQFGDFTSNIALKLSKELATNPREVATKIKEALLQENFEWLKDVEIAGPGFLNFTLSDSALWEQANSAPYQFMQGENVVLEYSCPNAFKELHAGHLYQTIVGDVLGNMLLRAGAQVTRTNFGGDVGLHVAKSMWGVQDLLQGFDASKLEAMQNTEHASFLSKAYVHGAKTYEDNDSVKLQIEDYNKQVYGLHNDGEKDSDFSKVYWICRTWSYEYFKDFYLAIEVAPFDRYYPESETAPVGLALVRGATDVFEESEGAIIFKGEDVGLHTRVFITRENLPTYETKDLGVIKLEHDEYNFEKRILITGNDQTEYMKVVFAAAAQVMPDVAQKMRHLTNGTIRFGDGQKMSSRLGNVARAIDVIDGASQLVEADSEDVKKILSLGAVKYSFLKQRFGADIAFNLEESVSLHGNSGPYLQYAYVRAHSILQKAVATNVEPKFTESEREFAQKISQIEIVMADAARELAQQIICTYLYELAQSFNRFYEDNRVIDDERQAVRLMLVARYAQILHDGLAVLGIGVPEKM